MSDPDALDLERRREILIKEPGDFALTLTTLAYPDRQNPSKADPVDALARSRAEV